MKRVLSVELKKAFCNKRFIFSLTAALFFTLMSGFLQVQGYINRTKFLNLPEYQNVINWSKDYHLDSETMVDFWIGMDFATWCGTAFFFLLPLLAVLPYGGSLHREYKSGYLNLITQQVSQKRYFTAKFLAAFLSGGLVIVLPMAVNVIFVACMVPLRLPSVLEVIYNGVYGFGLWAEVFYTHPVLYILLYLFLDFLFAGAIATVPMALYKMKHQSLVLTLPFVVLMVFHIFLSMLYMFVPFCLSPLDFLRAVNVSPYGANLWTVVTEFVLLLLPGLITVFIWRKKDVL